MKDIYTSFPTATYESIGFLPGIKMVRGIAWNS